MAFLETRGLSRHYGTVQALAPLDLDLERGELVTLLGPSGCGKTTLLRLVAGFATPSTGRVVVDGVDVTGLAPNRREMGMVFQAYSLFPHLSAEDNVRFGLRVRGWAAPERERRVRELFELIGLESARRRFPHQLSGGQQQRVALARALAAGPRVLLLDEPLSALDAQVRVGLRQEIRRIQRETGTTTLFVTHDQEEALSLSDRVVVMNAGRVEQVGTPEAVYRSPASAFVADFVGVSSRLEGVVLDPALGVVALDHGARVMLDAARGRANGERLPFYARPENVRLEPGDGPEAGPGRVVDRTFLGPITRVTVDLGGSDRVVADLSGDEAAGLAVGTPVSVRVVSPRPF